MNIADVVVIGGSAAGLSAAVTCRRHYPEKRVLVIRKESQVLIPCGIPYIFGTVGSPDKNLIPDSNLTSHGVDLIVDEVSDINRKEKMLQTAGGRKIGYDRLVFATGSSPLILPIPGVEKKNVFPVKKDVAYLNQMLDKLDRASNLVIIGGGYIGSEFADECNKRRGINITIVEKLPHLLMQTLDEEFCIEAEKIEKQSGIHILTSETVVSILGNGKVEKVRLSSGKELAADIVLLGAGSVANTGLAEKVGLEMGPTGGIQVSRYMQTSDSNVFACGDCAEKTSFFDGKPSNLKLASTATKEGRIVGANLFGTCRMNEGVLGVYSTVLGDTAFAVAGLTQEEARQKGYKTVVGESQAPNRHPGAMPGAANLKVKLMFEKSNGRVLGGQAMGAKSAGGMINTVSACINQKMTADEMAMFPAGTHPALTSSPVVYQLTNAAEAAIELMKRD